MRFYKSVCDFLATLLTFRLVKAFDQANLLEERSYKQPMYLLKRAKKVRSDRETWRLIRLNSSHEEVLQELGLILKLEKPPKRKQVGKKEAKQVCYQKAGTTSTADRIKRSRPKGSKNKPKPDNTATG